MKINTLLKTNCHRFFERQRTASPAGTKNETNLSSKRGGKGRVDSVLEMREEEENWKK